jgi:hypothetical protein
MPIWQSTRMTHLSATRPSYEPFWAEICSLEFRPMGIENGILLPFSSRILGFTHLWCRNSWAGLESGLSLEFTFKNRCKIPFTALSASTYTALSTPLFVNTEFHSNLSKIQKMVIDLELSPIGSPGNLGWLRFGQFSPTVATAYKHKACSK